MNSELTKTEEFKILSALKTFICDQYVMYNKYEDQAPPKSMLQDYCKFIYAISVDGKSDTIDDVKYDYAQSIYGRCLDTAKDQARGLLKHKVTVIPPMFNSESLQDILSLKV